MINELKKMELHDSPLNSVKIDFENELIELNITKSLTLQEMTLLFLQVSQINLSDIQFIDEAEVFRAEITEVENEFNIRIIFLAGFGEKDFSLSFNFKEVKTTPKA